MSVAALQRHGMVTRQCSVGRNVDSKVRIQAATPADAGSWESNAMRALVWHGKEDIRCDTVSDPEIQDSRDAIVKVTSCAICGSDLHLFHNFVPAMLPGDIMGHEMMGEVVEVGSGLNGNLKVGDRVVVPFTIICGECEQCKRGAYPSGRAEYLRVPFADRTHIKIPAGLTDDQVLFLGDIFPTGWQAAVQCEIEDTDTVVIWGCGPVGQMAIRSAVLLGARQVVAIDRLPERLSMAEAGGAITINFDQESVVGRLNDLTDGKGPQKCIDATGLESHVTFALPDTIYDRAKQMLGVESDRPHVLREMIYVCRPAGTISIPGVYAGLVDKIPMGQAMNKGLTFRMGQTHVNRWADDLLRRIAEGQIDPSFVITHTARLQDGPEMYKVFRDKQDSCVKVVLKP
jgi:threonine dehydrogenase-like Zn-dependent dehydrogenase